MCFPLSLRCVLHSLILLCIFHYLFNSMCLLNEEEKVPFICIVVHFALNFAKYCLF